MKVTSVSETALSRRNLLLGIAAASTAMAASPGAAGETEAPELIRKADALPALSRAHVRAVEDVASIVAEWQPKVPTPDFEIVRYGEGCRRYETLEGQGITAKVYKKSDYETVPNLGTPETFEANYRSSLAEADRKAKTPSRRGMKQALSWAKRNRELIEPARAYWSEFDRIKEASGINAAKAKVVDTREAFREAVSAIMATEERTMAGVVIKAQALAEWSNVEYFFKALNTDAPKWSDQMAAAIMRQAGGSVGSSVMAEARTV